MRSMSLNRYRLSSIPLCIGQPSEFTHLFIHHLSIFNVISGMLKRVLFKRCRLRLNNRRLLSPEISLKWIFLIQSLRWTGLNDPALWSGGWLGGIYLINSIDLSNEDRLIYVPDLTLFISRDYSEGVLIWRDSDLMNTGDQWWPFCRLSVSNVHGLSWVRLLFCIGLL
jgi:hypothetical protein